MPRSNLTSFAASRSLRRRASRAAVLALLTFAAGCTDPSAGEQAAATKALEAASRAYGNAAAAESPEARSAAFRQAASQASALQGASEDQKSAGELLAAGASAEAARSEFEVAAGALARIQRARRQADRLAMVATDLRTTAEALAGSPIESDDFQAGQERASAAIAALRADRDMLGSRLEEATAAGEAATSSSAQATHEAAAILLAATGASPRDRLDANGKARVARERAIQDREAAAQASLDGALIAIDLALAEVHAAKAESISEANAKSAAAVREANEALEAAASRLSSEATAIDARVSAMRDEARALAEGELRAAVDAGLQDLQSADTHARNAQRGAGQAAAARAIQARVQLDTVRAQQILLQAGLSPDSSAAGEALAQARQATASIGDDGLDQSLGRLEAALRGEAIRRPGSGSGGGSGSTASDGDTSAGAGFAGAGGATGSGAPRNVGGLASPDDILALLDGRSSNFSQWAEAIGTQDPALVPAVGAMRSFATWMVPVAEAAAETWGSGGAVFLQGDGVGASPPTLSHDGGDAATIEIGKADGSTKSIALFSQDGAWFMEVGSLLDSPEAAAQIEQMLQAGPAIVMLAPTFEAASAQVAEQVRSGAVASPDDLWPAITAKMAEVMQRMQGAGAP